MQVVLLLTCTQTVHVCITYYLTIRLIAMFCKFMIPRGWLIQVLVIL